MGFKRPRVQVSPPRPERRSFPLRRSYVFFIRKSAVLKEGDEMLKCGDKIGIVACSNAFLPSEKNQITELADSFVKLGLTPVFSKYIFEQKFALNGTGAERASVLNGFYNDDRIRAIFDVSGGDTANELLDYIDYDSIKKHPKPFFGYSDLTTVINAIYKKTGNPSFLYQVRCLVLENQEIQTSNFNNSILNGQEDLYKIKWNFVRGSKIDGIVLGGNIRCLLKLAGTQYMPDFDDKVLFIESYGGGVALMKTYLCQLNQMGVFRKISGLLMGTFTKMEENNESPNIEDLVLNVVDKRVPIAKTQDVGHGNNSKCFAIGKEYVCGV
jgi:muramoyltetrapeptide carboxypeptidase